MRDSSDGDGDLINVKVGLDWLVGRIAEEETLHFTIVQ